MADEGAHGFFVCRKGQPVSHTHAQVKGPQEASAKAAARRPKTQLGPIHYQLPPKWHKDLQRLREFAEALPNDLFHAVEFRDRSWLEENTYELLSEYGIALCVHDLLPRHPRRVTGTLVYVRFHGTGDKYAGSYRPSRLEGWAEWIQEAADQVPVFVYFNNDTHRHAVRNAESLEKLVFA